jgi:hypothetical protein
MQRLQRLVRTEEKLAKVIKIAGKNKGEAGKEEMSGEMEQLLRNV